MARKAKVRPGQIIQGTDGDDSLSGTSGRDTFIYSGEGDDVITDFSTTTPDYIVLDSGTGVYDGMLGGHLGHLWDGMELFNSRGTLVATVEEADVNGDGIMDTQFVMDGGTLTLLGVSATDLTGTMIFGG